MKPAHVSLPGEEAYRRKKKARSDVREKAEPWECDEKRRRRKRKKSNKCEKERIEERIERGQK